jgi:probable phosphoglycerate mutase
VTAGVPVELEPRRHEVVLVRHGETDWSLAGKHTGRTDVPLNERGRGQARALAGKLAGRHFVLVLTSPLSRATETCRLAGLASRAMTRDELAEWDYGAYEGRTTPEIRAERPGWSLWRDGVVDGETIAQVGARVDRLLPELDTADGDVAVFAHGHLLRVLGARWIQLEASAGRLLALDPATMSALGYEHESRVLRAWNEGCSEPAAPTRARKDAS